MADLGTDPSKPGLFSQNFKTRNVLEAKYTRYLYVSESTDLLHSSPLSILEGTEITFILFEQF